jgi:zinc transport system ATP-binding protein
MNRFARYASGPSVRFEKVCLELGGNEILRDVTFGVERGSIHCLVGPNGGGKTSLVRCLLGQMPHTGTIRVCWGRARVMGYVPQALDFDDTLPMTVADFMAVIGGARPAFLRSGKGARKRVDAALDRVGMLDRRDRPFGSLSGGERQRVLLAQALNPEPDLLILDEPANGLDKFGAAAMQTIIEDMSGAGATVILIHHDLAVVRGVAHGVTCINRGVVFTGDPAEGLTPERILEMFSATARAA